MKTVCVGWRLVQSEERLLICIAFYRCRCCRRIGTNIILTIYFQQKIISKWQRAMRDDWIFANWAFHFYRWFWLISIQCVLIFSIAASTWRAYHSLQYTTWVHGINTTNRRAWQHAIHSFPFVAFCCPQIEDELVSTAFTWARIAFVSVLVRVHPCARGCVRLLAAADSDVDEIATDWEFESDVVAFSSSFKMIQHHAQ